MRCRNCTETRPRLQRLQRVDHHLLDFLVADRAWPTRTRLVDEPLQPVPARPVTPATCGPSHTPAPKTAHSKDCVETKFKNAVCAGTITLSAARSAIKNHWTTALQVTGIRLTPSTRRGVQATCAGCSGDKYRVRPTTSPRAAEQTATLAAEEQQSKPAE
ncbi:hypothetical protein ACWDA7_44650 [Streptomyces sp. NPDC001156]